MTGQTRDKLKRLSLLLMKAVESACILHQYLRIWINQTNARLACFNRAMLSNAISVLVEGIR